MTAPRTLLLPVLLLTLFASSNSQKYPDSTAPPAYLTDPDKPQAGVCGNIAEEWEVLKHHVMSLHGQGAALEKLSHHVRELGDHLKHLTDRVNHCKCGGGDNKREELIKAIGGILKMSMMFFEAQRSGPLPADNHIPWRQNSGMKDVGYNGEDLTGGWYEGATGAKSILPMAYSTTVLIAGILMGSDAYEMTGLMGHVFNSIRWPLDYFIKCHVKRYAFYAQVDESYLHAWIRPKDITTPQPAYMLNETNPGSAVAAETAAALAAGSMVFRKKEAAYADTLLKHARELYEFAYKFQGSFEKATETPNDFKDELAWGALWLNLATDERQYIDMAKEFMTLKVPKTFSYLDKTVGAQLLYAKVTNETAYRDAVEVYLRQWFPGGTVKYSPRGLASFRPDGGSIGYAANAAFMAVSAAHFDILPEEALKFVRSQLEYILGVGEHEGRSFMVGFGKDWPQHARHAAASCDSVCEEDRSGPNPHILFGALVAGPGATDDFADNRTDTLRNRVSITFNAGFQSALAAILGSLLKMDEFGSTNYTPDFTPTPGYSDEPNGPLGSPAP